MLENWYALHCTAVYYYILSFKLKSCSFGIDTEKSSLTLHSYWWSCIAKSLRIDRPLSRVALQDIRFLSLGGTDK